MTNKITSFADYLQKYQESVANPEGVNALVGMLRVWAYETGEVTNSEEKRRWNQDGYIKPRTARALRW